MEDGSCSPPALGPVRPPIDFSVCFFLICLGYKDGVLVPEEAAGGSRDGAGTDGGDGAGMERGLMAGMEQGCRDRGVAGMRGQAECSGLELSGKDSE